MKSNGSLLLLWIRMQDLPYACIQIAFSEAVKWSLKRVREENWSQLTFKSILDLGETVMQIRGCIYQCLL